MKSILEVEARTSLNIALPARLIYRSLVLRGTQGRARFYSVIKKRQEMSTKTERERFPVLDIIRYVYVHFGKSSAK
jgi:hypothetical protein